MALKRTLRKTRTSLGTKTTTSSLYYSLPTLLAQIFLQSP
jgi:hypothetical protein